VHTWRVSFLFYLNLFIAEVTTGFTYNGKVDVFSYGIILWCIANGDFQPYKTFHGNLEMQVAQNPNFRPLIEEDNHPAFLMEYWDTCRKCLSHEPKERPDFSECVKIMKKIRLIISRSKRGVKKQESKQKASSYVEQSNFGVNNQIENHSSTYNENSFLSEDGNLSQKKGMFPKLPLKIQSSQNQNRQATGVIRGGLKRRTSSSSNLKPKIPEKHENVKGFERTNSLILPPKVNPSRGRPNRGNLRGNLRGKPTRGSLRGSMRGN